MAATWAASAGGWARAARAPSYTADLRGSAFALKWHHPSHAALDTGLRPRLLRAIEQGTPNDVFLWPINLVEITGQPDASPTPSFGSIMRLRDPEYAGMRDPIARSPTSSRRCRSTPPSACTSPRASCNRMPAASATRT